MLSECKIIKRKEKHVFDPEFRKHKYELLLYFRLLNLKSIFKEHFSTENLSPQISSKA